MCDYFYGPMDQMFKEFLFLALVAEQNGLSNFGKGPYEEHLCEIILSLGQTASSGDAI